MTTIKRIFGRSGCVLLLLLTVFACSREEEEDGGSEMRPGENCNGCHGFSVAGTLFGTATAGAHEGLSGGTITLTGADGKAVTLSSNRVGNFYTDAAVSFPATASVTRNGVTRTMVGKVTSGACSHCHNSPPDQGAPGRLYVGD